MTGLNTVNGRWPEPPETRYQRDPVFRALVDMLSVFLEENALRQWTPTELREAVMVAAARYEMVHVRPLLMQKDLITGDWEHVEPRRRELP